MSRTHGLPFPVGIAMQDQAFGGGLVTAADTITGIHTSTTTDVLSRVCTPTPIPPVGGFDRASHP